jgi:uncharacterized coiled-coil protein SlyX
MKREELEKRIRHLEARRNEKYTTLREIEELEGILERLKQLESDLYDAY